MEINRHMGAMDPETDLLTQNEPPRRNSQDENDMNSGSYEDSDSYVEELKASINDVEKEQLQIKENVSYISSKMQYHIDEVKDEILTLVNALKSDYSRDIKELRSYLQTLHDDVQASETSVDKIRKSQMSNQFVANLSLEVSAVRKKLNEVATNQKA